MAKIACTYCNTLNDAAAKTCIGCGAPLEIPAPQQAYRPQAVQPAIKPAQASTPFSSTESQKLQDGAQQIDRLYKGAVSAYQTAWSVTGDAIAISLVAFALGLVGGATGMGFWGVLGAILAGLVIGFTDQFFWVNVIAPPAGAVLGILGWGVVWAAGGGPQGMVFAATALACLGGLVGARRRTTHLGCSAVVRPLLGAAGAFFFALLGLIFGLAIRAVL